MVQIYFLASDIVLDITHHRWQAVPSRIQSSLSLFNCLQKIARN